MKRLLILVLMFNYNQVVLAECLVAHVCWMGNECVKEYLISSDHHGDQVKVRIRDDSINDGKIASRGSIQNLTVLCKNEPPSDHAHAIEWTRWMAVCKGKRTAWSSTSDWYKATAGKTLTSQKCR